MIKPKELIFKLIFNFKINFYCYDCIRFAAHSAYEYQLFLFNIYIYYNLLNNKNDI